MSYWSKYWGKIWVYKGFTLLFLNSCQIDSTKKAIVGMVFWLPPNHLNAKLQSFSRTLNSLLQMFKPDFRDYLWSLWFVLITKLYAKIGMISFSNKLCYKISFIGYFELTTKITKWIRLIFTRSTSWCHFQYVFMQTVRLNYCEIHEQISSKT